MAPQDFLNANDIIITIQGNTAGGTGHVILSDFDYSDDNDTQELSGIGNRVTQGVSHGNLTAQFSVTAQGEPAEMINDLMPEDDGKAPDCQATAFGELSRWNIGHWWPSSRSFSASDGDPAEFEAEGPCIPVKQV